MPMKTSWQPRLPSDVYLERILSMMNDYGISLAQAIAWDVEGFPPLYPGKIILTVEDELKYYYHVNRIPESDHQFFTDILTGREKDYGLTKTKQKDDGSSEGA